MTDPIEFSRRLRRRIETAGLSADIAADINVVVSGGGSATAVQHAPIRQDRSDRDGSGAPETKEQP